MIKRYPIDAPSGIKHGIVSVDGCDLSPGVTVYYSGYPLSRGILVSITDEELIVLWSTEPEMASFKDFVMPLVRRVFPSTIAKSLISVQPMIAPSSSIFYLDYKYGEKTEPSGSV